MMCHALIIGDNMLISRAIERYLEPLGFRSFDRSWTERQALAAAERRRPHLIVLGEELEFGSGLNAASVIASRDFVPVLIVNGDSARAKACLEEVASDAGPFLLGEIETAVELAFSRGPGANRPLASEAPPSRSYAGAGAG